ncbi:Protein CBG26410 [Caenorhabditis briggsae]|uniref:Uncharacterized protein n=2 Tax=Caenorhabditis briggsae TaxID=6238 RepID=A0AAE9AA46_CAEBR|nr:Protein CBG26410 [Caenorhabditis briggsae]ULT94427.1 hypothetical protein L3Y34_003714 [Caenorhabditis briggsae]CAS00723.1 Protein CBG26410 [Caenorhabditis briggsae]
MSVNIANVPSSSNGQARTESQKLVDEARREADESYQNFHNARERVYEIQYELLAAYDQEEAFEAKIKKGPRGSEMEKLQQQHRAAEVEVGKVQQRLDKAVEDRKELFVLMEAEEMKYEWIKSIYGANQANAEAN